MSSYVARATIIAASLALVVEGAAVSPTCGKLTDAAAVNTNAGITLSNIKTIVAFGDGYTVQNSDTDGPVWVEYLADAIGAKVINYAVSGSVVDESYYDTHPSSTDFVAQVNKAASSRDKPDPATTLYTMYLGMEDYKRMDAATFPSVASNIAYQSLVLTSSPRAKNLLYLDSYGRGKNSTSGEEYKLNLFKSVGALHNRNANVGFVDVGQVFDQVSADSGDIPSTQGHKVIADYVQAVLEECV